MSAIHTNVVHYLGRVWSILLVLALFTTFSTADAKTKVTREYDKSDRIILNIISNILPEMNYKVGGIDRSKGKVSFETTNKRDMSIRVLSKGKDTCSVEITGSAWFSDEPEEVAAKIHAKINDVLIRKEAKKRGAESRAAQKSASTQAAQSRNPVIHCPKCGTAFKANGTYVGRMAGTAAGAAAGAYVGSGIGIATLGTGFAATIPLGIGGGIIGFFAGGYYDNNTCPKCGHRFKQ